MEQQTDGILDQQPIELGMRNSEKKNILENDPTRWRD
jgi:hypothetical protein